MFLVTNKHVLEDVDELRVQFIRATPNGTQPLLGQPATVTIERFNVGLWKGHPDPAVDVAAIPIGRWLEGLEAIGHQPFLRSVGPEIAADARTWQNFDAIEEVTFFGYPSGIFDTANLLPVARRGVTATPITLDYRGEPAFLIDASVFPGSSGSPVFIFNQGIYFDRRRNANIAGSRIFFLGVLAAVHVRQVQGSIAAALPANLAVQTEETLDLGIVYKAAAVDAVADLYLKEAGWRRVEQSTVGSQEK